MIGFQRLAQHLIQPHLGMPIGRDSLHFGQLRQPSGSRAQPLRR